jgi:two-component system phosphate regulon sensor histidine kinase PhoR
LERRAHQPFWWNFSTAPQIGPLKDRETDLLLWLIRILGLLLAVSCVFLAWYGWKRRYDEQVDTLIERCHSISLADPLTFTPPQLNLPDLGRLDLAILVMRDVLLDYLVIYRRFFEAAPDMFLSLTPAGKRIQDANQAFFTKLGLLEGEVLGQPVDRFVTLDQGWDQALKDEGKLQRGYLSTGREQVKVEVSLSWEQRTRGQPWILGARLSDVTERERLMSELISKSAALEKALEEARSVEKLKDEFLTTLSP